MNIFEKDKEYIANTYARNQVEFTSGKGSLMYSAQGKEYIDMGSGIAVNSFGIADEEWLAAVTAQASQLQHTSNLYYTEPCVLLAEELCRRTGMKKVFFANSGAEANEGAIKAARAYAHQKYGDSSHSTIITLKGSFHGRTITTLSATGQDGYHTVFSPFTEGFVYADPDCPEELEKLVSEIPCCAIMLEIIRGEGGVCPVSQEFIDKVKFLARKYELLIIVDEVQTGNGRTGKLYSYMHFGLEPDIVTTAKGLAGGLPIGAVLLGEKTQFSLSAGMHGSTFGGNPVCCAAALSIIKRLDDKLMEQVIEKSEYIKARLNKVTAVTEISGLGLMLGIKCNKSNKEIAEYCLDNGLIVLTAKDKIRLLPALNIPFDLLEKAMDILCKAIEA